MFVVQAVPNPCEMEGCAVEWNGFLLYHHTREAGLWTLSNQPHILNITHFMKEELFLILLILLNKPSGIDFGNNMWSIYLGECIKVLHLYHIGDIGDW